MPSVKQKRLGSSVGPKQGGQAWRHGGAVGILGEPARTSACNGAFAARSFSFGLSDEAMAYRQTSTDSHGGRSTPGLGNLLQFSCLRMQALRSSRQTLTSKDRSCRSDMPFPCAGGEVHEVDTNGAFNFKNRAMLGFLRLSYG